MNADWIDGIIAAQSVRFDFRPIVDDRDKGFSYALDDVGEGYSTIEMLAELQLHYRKLDMKYTQGVATDFEWLKVQGYRLFQGYWIGRPGPLSNRV